jgi:hypothetical protein
MEAAASSKIRNETSPLTAAGEWDCQLTRHGNADKSRGSLALRYGSAILHLYY